MEQLNEVPSPRQRIDYHELAELYNAAQIKGGVQLEQVYNITLFKRALKRRGLEDRKDFTAYTKGVFTYVERLTSTRMNKE